MKPISIARAARAPEPRPVHVSILLVCALAVALALGLALGAGRADAEAGSGPSVIQVYKTPTCGCCTKWIDHLREAGFAVEATDLPDLAAVKAANGVFARLASCHTAVVDGYVVEGHVPAGDLRRLLRERPALSGLAVPGMPMGSPGMEHPDPERHEPYRVIAFGPEGQRVYSTIAPDGQRVHSPHRP